MSATQKFYSVFFLVLAILVVAAFEAGYKTGSVSRAHAEARVPRAASTTGP